MVVEGYVFFIDSFSLSLLPDAELQDPDPVHIQSHEIRKCKITTSLAYARYGRYNFEPACFVKYCFNFVPFDKLHFGFVEIRIRFEPDEDAQDGGNQPGRLRKSRPRQNNIGNLASAINQTPNIISYEPKGWAGEVERNQRPSGYAARLDVGTPGINIGLSHETQSETRSRTLVTSHRESRSNVIWRLSENEVSRKGVPNPFEVAMIVSTGTKTNPGTGTGVEGKRFRAKVAFTVKLSRSVNPLNWVQGHARKNDELVFRSDTTVGQSVEGIDFMEHENFQLDSFTRGEWNL